MGVVFSSNTPAPTLGPDAESARPEPRETGGVTTRLILDYVEREAGRDGVDRLLASCDLTHREHLLRDENHWSSFETKIAMLEAAAEVLDDPLAARHVGAAGMDFNVAPALKLSLRAFGTVRLLYRNIPRTCAKFSTTHRMEALEVGRHHARIAYIHASDKGYHPADCELNIGFLSCAPSLFGLPHARMSHPVCAKDGGDRCIYDIRWESGASRLRRGIGGALLAFGLLGAAELLDPALLPEAGVASLAVATRWGVGEARFHRRRLHLLENRAGAEIEASERLATSLQDLISDLRLDEVLAKITGNAQFAVNGKDFVLLVAEADGMHCRSSSTIPRHAIAALEQWASSADRLTISGTVIDDLGEVPALAELPRDRALPLGSLAAAPLVFRGESLGLLVALSNGEDGFLPHDVKLLESYAAQAAIALTNARLYDTQEQLATRDPLTGLLNHREFHEAVGRELERCRRHGGELGVVLLDLDGFKHVNDTSGHAAGDLVLTSAAHRLRGCCRDQDLAFRVGGDEFALVLRGTSGREAVRIAERAAGAIRSTDSRVSASYGIGEWPGDGPTKDTLLQRADERLYAMKRSGPVRSIPVSVATDEGGRRREQLACASRLSTRLAPLLDAAAIARTTVEELDGTFGFPVTVLWQLGDDMHLRPLASAGEFLAPLEGFADAELPVESGVVGRAVRNGEAALVRDTLADPDYMPGDGERLRCVLAVPVRVAGDIWGVLQIVERAAGAFDSDDLVFADLLATHIGAALDRTRLFGELEGTFMTTLGALCDALERKDAYTAAHAREVEDLSERVARRLGLSGEDLRQVRYGALLHDIGKIGIRSEILNKPGRLTEEEFEEIKQHTLIGSRMLERIPFFADVHRLVRWAHERWDGRGYPDGLAGSEIPLGARIICVCDAFHAMTSERPYSAAVPFAEAIAELRRCAGRQFDPRVTDALVLETFEQLGRTGSAS